MVEREPAVIARIIEALPAALAVYVFGSRVRGEALLHSDLDVAVLVDGRADTLFLWHLASELADITGCPVDLVDLGAASTVMQYQVITTGRRVWCRDPQACMQAGVYEAFILSEKTDLDHRRAALIADIEREGTVHDR